MSDQNDKNQRNKLTTLNGVGYMNLHTGYLSVAIQEESISLLTEELKKIELANVLSEQDRNFTKKYLKNHEK